MSASSVTLGMSLTYLGAYIHICPYLILGVLGSLNEIEGTKQLYQSKYAKEIKSIGDDN